MPEHGTNEYRILRDCYTANASPTETALRLNIPVEVAEQWLIEIKSLFASDVA